MTDINKAISSNEIKNGRSIVKTSINNISALLSNLTKTINLTDIQSKYDNKFDDANYYGGSLSNYFVTIGYNSDKAIYSSDGINWNQTTLPNQRLWNSIAYGNGKYVAVAESSQFMAVSSDGINWSEYYTLYGQWKSITYGNSKNIFVAITDGPIAGTSTDGISWTQRSISNRSWYDITTT